MSSSLLHPSIGLGHWFYFQFSLSQCLGLDLSLGSSVGRATDSSFQASSSSSSALALTSEPVMNQIKSKVNLYTPPHHSLGPRSVPVWCFHTKSSSHSAPFPTTGSANDINNVQRKVKDGCVPEQSPVEGGGLQPLQGHQICH